MVSLRIECNTLSKIIEDAWAFKKPSNIVRLNFWQFWHSSYAAKARKCRWHWLCRGSTNRLPMRPPQKLHLACLAQILLNSLMLVDLIWLDGLILFSCTWQEHSRAPGVTAISFLLLSMTFQATQSLLEMMLVCWQAERLVLLLHALRMPLLLVSVRAKSTIQVFVLGNSLQVLQIELQHPLLRNTEYARRAQIAGVIMWVNKKWYNKNTGPCVFFASGSWYCWEYGMANDSTCTCVVSWSLCQWVKSCPCETQRLNVYLCGFLEVVMLPPRVVKAAMGSPTLRNHQVGVNIRRQVRVYKI